MPALYKDGKNYSHNGPQVDVELTKGSPNAARSGDVYDKFEEVNTRLTQDTYTTSWKGKEFFFFRYGHIVIMNSPNDLPKGQTLSAGETTIFTLPEEFKPSQRTYGCVGNRTDDTRVFVYNDVIALYTPKDIIGKANLALTCVYYVK